MKKFFLFAATLLGLVACNKNEADINVPARQITIHATANVDNDGAANGPHRIAPNDITASSVSFHWQEGDKVWVLSNDFSEKQIFTIDNSSINGNQADFTGTALSDMSSYYVIYLDNMVSEETLMASISSENPVTYNYNPDSKNWFFAGEGHEDNFTIGCEFTIRMQLKGSCKLSKVTLLWMDDGEPEGYAPATTTINFVHGSYDGLQLTSTPVEVVMPLSIKTVYGFTLRFYDTDDNLIMEKSKEGSSLYNDFDNYGLVNLGVLEVAAVIPEEVNWTKSLSLGKSVATAIEIETGEDVSGYTENDTHQKLDNDGFLWAYLDGTTLKIQTPASMINSNLNSMFANYSAVQSISGLQYIHATTAKKMFFSCIALTDIDFTGFNTEDITDMKNMFNNCTALTNLDLSDFNTVNVLNMCGMFDNCGSLESIEFFDSHTLNVTDMSSMFNNCTALTSLDLSDFKTENVTDMNSMFSNCSSLQSLELSDDFIVAGIRNYMFVDCGGDVDGGCTVYGVTDSSIKEALKDGTNWEHMHFDGEEEII